MCDAAMLEELDRLSREAEQAIYGLCAKVDRDLRAQRGEERPSFVARVAAVEETQARIVRVLDMTLACVRGNTAAITELAAEMETVCRNAPVGWGQRLRDAIQKAVPQ